MQVGYDLCTPPPLFPTVYLLLSSDEAETTRKLRLSWQGHFFLRRLLDGIVISFKSLVAEIFNLKALVATVGIFIYFATADTDEVQSGATQGRYHRPYERGSTRSRNLFLRRAQTKLLGEYWYACTVQYSTSTHERAI